MKGLPRQLAVLASCAVMIYVNFFVSSSGDFEGSGPEAGSASVYDMFPTAFSPAPYTFTVWLPIFLGLVLFALYQARPAKRHDETLDALGLPATAAFVMNTLQAYPRMGFNTLAVVALLVSLIFVFRVLTRAETPQGKGFTWFVRVPFVLFFGWMTVATTLSICQWLVSIGWSGFGISAPLWAALLILIAMSIGVVVVRRFRAVSYGVVLMWGFVGIVMVDPGAVPVLVATAVAVATLGWSIARVLRSGSLRLAG